MAVQGHPTKSAVLPHFRDIAGFLLKQTPHLYSVGTWGCSPCTRSPMRSEGPMLIVCVITFESNLHDHGTSMSWTDGQTDDLC